MTLAYSQLALDYLEEEMERVKFRAGKQKQFGICFSM